MPELTVTLAQAAEGGSAWVASGGAVGLLGVVGFLLYRLIRTSNASQDLFVKRAWYRIDVLERENRVCNRRQAMLIEELHRHGVPVDARVWSLAEDLEPPIVVPDELRER